MYCPFSRAQWGERPPLRAVHLVRQPAPFLRQLRVQGAGAGAGKAARTRGAAGRHSATEHPSQRRPGNLFIFFYFFFIIIILFYFFQF